MATYDFIVNITDQNGSTATLTSSPYDIRKPALRAADRNEDEAKNILEIRLMDGSVANNLDELRTLNTLLADAHERNRRFDKRINPVYVTWQEAAGGTVWRSEIVDAKADWLDDALIYGYWKGDTQFADLDITRKNFWEGPEAQIPLTNPNGTANTSGLNVYNCNDGSGSGGSARYNYIDVPGTAVLGDLPGATRLEMTSTDTDATHILATVWIGQNWTNPSTFTHFYEIEAGSVLNGGTALVSGDNSGGTAIRWTISQDSETELFQQALSSAQLDAAEGGYYKVMLANSYLLSFDTLIRWRVKLKYTTVTIWQSDSLIALDTNINRNIIDLATIKIPPWLPGLANLESLNLVLSAYQNDYSPSQTEQLDFIQLMPLDGWRFIDHVGYGTPETYRIVDDGINGYLYHDDGSGDHKLGHYVGYGRPIMLKPSTNQRLYFLMHTNYAGYGEIDRSISVKLHYRPRRLSL